ncbi:MULTISPECIES: 4Fe-4S binding protein [Methanobacterium]|uniref:4Fe-4S binding protein n=1 Tax=Methanobacterium veterum TaxID=408577 RepID=A0A9E5A3X6_9EURY|nr:MULTISPECIES: 4Fe-4S binding protein [Methanobacterium]MCZ3366611.1 4Fe-4S binding protein [Methanobacterium veterum]MCZ3374245.1 4Fe-4S binding protein [Methanobacterium veterum]
MDRQNKRKGILLIALLIFPLFKPFLSPVTVMMGTVQGVIVGGLVIYISLFLSSLFVGRAFCGWLCPAGGIQEYCSVVVNKTPKSTKFKKLKYIFWLGLVSAIAVAIFKSGGLNHIDLLYQSKLNIPELQEYIIYYAGVGIITILAFTVGKRAGCLYICWLAPFMVVGTRIKELAKYPSLYIRTDPQKCINCDICNDKCPMSINISGRVKNKFISDSECIMCGECVDACPEKVMSYNFGSIKKK